jgi:hypothetical protein
LFSEVHQKLRNRSVISLGGDADGFNRLRAMFKIGQNSRLELATSLLSFGKEFASFPLPSLLAGLSYLDMPRRVIALAEAALSKGPPCRILQT